MYLGANDVAVSLHQLYQLYHPGEDCWYWGKLHVLAQKSLYLPLNFAVKLKLFLKIEYIKKKKNSVWMISIRITSEQGFSGGSVVKNLPVNLPGDMDLIPDPGWHASEQLSPYPQLLNL